MPPVDVDAITKEIEGCMKGHGAGLLPVVKCPRLAQLGEDTLGVGLTEDSDLHRFVEAAVASTEGVCCRRVADDLVARAHLAGVLAFFHIRDRPGGGPNRPDASELEAIRRAHLGKGMGSKDEPALIARLSWAKWRQDVESSGGLVQPTRAPTSASAKDYRERWARALAECLADAADFPESVRVCMARSRHGAWGVRVMGTLRESEDYAAAVRLREGEYVERSVERELWASVASGSAVGRYLVVGEAGFGKTTVLWSLHQRFEAESDVVAFFVSAAWIMQPGVGENPTADMVAAVEAVLADELRPVVLLDTIDLLLHDEASRRTLRKLLADLARRTVVVSTCRPQEESLVRGDFDWVRQLDAYDDAELDRALPLLAGVYCPSADVPGLSRRVRSATARGLPVADVCRSPLMLRLLFDLFSPAEPELLDMDVTGLFSQHWKRRVALDARHERALGMRESNAENLSSVAGWLGVGLLSRGVVELPEEILHQAGMEASGGAIASREMESGIDVLLERGVLRRSGELIGFLHQTMFEYVAARGLQAAGMPSRLTVMADRVLYGGDLFVGAVLEQALILAGRDPVSTEAAAQVVARLSRAPNAAIEAIAAVAWAHHHRLAERNSEPRLSLAGLVRAARVIPTVAGKSAGEAVSQLSALWGKADSPHLRRTILGSFVRVAMRDPHAVLKVVTTLDGLEEASNSSDESRQIMITLIDLLSAANRSEARRLVRAMATAVPLSPVVLRYLADKWEQLGSPDLLARLEEVEDEQPSVSRSVIQSIGAMRAAQWHLSGSWSSADEGLTSVRDTIYSGDQLFLTDWVNLHAVRAYLRYLSDDAAGEAIDALLSLPSPLAKGELLPAREVLFTVLFGEERSAAILVSRMAAAMKTIGADAQYGRLTETQLAILDMLSRQECPGDIPAKVLPRHLGRADWLADHRLTQLLPAVAASGDVAAWNLLRSITAQPSAHTTAAMASPLLLAGKSHTELPRQRDVQELAVRTALAGTRYDRVLAGMVVGLDWTTPPLSRYRQQVAEHARNSVSVPLPTAESMLLYVLTIVRFDGLSGSDPDRLREIARRVPNAEQQIILDFIDSAGATIPAAMTYLSELIQVLPRKDRQLPGRTRQHQYARRALEVMIRLATSGDPTGSPAMESQPREWMAAGYHVKMLDYLNRTITIVPSRRPPIQPANGYSPDTFTVHVLHMLLAFAQPVDPDAWPKVRVLGLYDYRESQVTARRFGLTCHYLAELSRTHLHQSVEHFVGYMGEVGHSRRFAADEDVPPELQVMVELVCAHGDDSQLEVLLGACARLPDSFVETIIRIVAEQRYTDMQRLLPRTLRMSPVGEFVMELSLSVERGRGTTAFAEILPSA